MIFKIKRNEANFVAKSSALLVLSGLLLSFLSVPVMALAQNMPPMLGEATAAEKSVYEGGGAGGFLSSFLLDGLNAILTGLLVLLAKLTGWTGIFFDSVFLMNMSAFKDDMSTIVAGWSLSRDIANIFFILILMVIAIATILRFESYNARRLLPKLIVIALLINFSLTFSFLILDFANFLALGFYERIGLDPAIKIAGGTRMQEIFQIKGVMDGGSSAATWTLGGVLGGAAVCVTASAIAAATGVGAAAVPFACAKTAIFLGGAFAGFKFWKFFNGEAAMAKAINYFSIIMVANVLAATLIFVFVFGGILLVIRYAVLVLLMILAPIAFIAYILPDTEGKIWKKWWDTFLMHTFFFPAFMFLLYMSLSLASIYLQRKAGGGFDNPGFLTNIVVIEVFLIGSLIIARQMGVYFASTVINMANKSKQYVAGYAGAMAIRNTVGKAGEWMQQKEWVRGNYYASRAAQGMTQYKGQGIFAKPGKSREEVAQQRARFDIASTFSKAPSEWHKDFANNKSYAFREAFARDIMGNPKRLEQFMKNADEGTKGAMLNVVRLKLGAEAEKNFQKASRQNDRNAELAKGSSLGTFFDGLGDEGQQRQHFKDLNARDQGELFSQWQGDATKRDLIKNWAKTELPPEEQERFYMQALNKANPAAKGEMFSGFSEDLQNKVIDSMSPRAIVEMRQNAGTNIGKIESAIGRLPTDKQEKIREEEARGIVRDLDKLAADLPAMSDDVKKSAIGLLRQDEIQKVADKVTDKGKFVDDVIKHAPNKTEQVLAVLPEHAGKVGKNPEDVVDWEKVSHKNPALKAMLKKAQSKDVGKIMRRGDQISLEYVEEINSLGDNIDDITDALEKTHGNKQMATMLRINPQLQQMVILPQKRVSRGGGGGGGGGTGGSGGTSGGGGSSAPPSSSGPKTHGTSGQPASSSAALPADISSPSVKAGYSFKNDFEGKGDAEYAITQSEKQFNKRKQLPTPAPASSSTAPAPSAPRSTGPVAVAKKAEKESGSQMKPGNILSAEEKAEIFKEIDKKAGETKKEITETKQEVSRSAAETAEAVRRSSEAGRMTLKDQYNLVRSGHEAEIKKFGKLVEDLETQDAFAVQRGGKAFNELPIKQAKDAIEKNRQALADAEKSFNKLAEEKGWDSPLS